MTVGGKIVNDSAIITFFNNADRHSTNDVIVYGVVNEDPLEIIPSYRILGSVLGPKQSINITIPLLKRMIVINLTSTTLEETYSELPERADVNNIVKGSAIIKYMINCVGCKNDNKIEYIFVTFKPGFTIQCPMPNIKPCNIKVSYYTWGSYPAT